MKKRPASQWIKALSHGQPPDRAIHALRRSGALAAAMLCAGCQPVRDPPPAMFFGGLPVSGKLIDAQRAGFTACFNTDAIRMRCRRQAVMVAKNGPYEAAVDLVGSDGRGGFDQVTLWHDQDNYAVYKITDALEQAGWSYCQTGEGRRGDQIIYTRKGSPVRISMDLSYWGKRRLRIIPEWNQQEPRCTPTQGPTPQGPTPSSPKR